MNDYENKKNRIEMDNNAMKSALSHLISIVEEGKEELFDRESNVVSLARREVLAYLGVKQIPIPEEIEDSNAQLEYLLRPTGIMKRRVELTDGWWKDTTGPLLGYTKDGSEIALLPTFPWGYSFYDIENKKRIKVNKKNNWKLGAEAFCFYRALPPKKLTMNDLIRFVLGSITASDILLVLLASFMVSLLGMFLPFMNKQIFNTVIPSGTKSDVFPLTCLLVGAAIGGALFEISRGLLLMRLRDKINISVQSAAMARLFGLPASFFKNHSAGELGSRIMSINSICNMLSDTVLSTGLAALFSFLYIFQMIHFAPALVMPSISILLFMFVFIIISGYVQQKLSKKRTNISAKINGLVFGLFGGIQKVKLAGAEKRAFAKWAKAYKEMGKCTYTPPMFLRINDAVSGALVLGGSIILYYFSGVHKIATSDFIAFSASYGVVSGAMTSLAGVIMTFATVKPLLEMIKPILDAVPEGDESKTQITSLRGNIELSNVSFRYSEDGPFILDHVSLKIHQGEYIAVVGSSGSGKSTLMRILLGFEKPGSGAVYYDGNDLNNLYVPSVRQHIGTCLQDGKLFSGDIFSNIIITAPWSTVEDAWEAARMAGLDQEISAMPMGMHTMISEGGGGISGGQRQRILIARALIGKPKILFFDEATSALDNLTQKFVANNITSLGCTRFVIAHRLSTVINCDRIIVLDKGKIVEEGNYKELMKRKGLFYDFAIRQEINSSTHVY
ncbi:NHLP bacteriocin export ABC transporter permease/ATPase subunit [Anaerotignum sp.]|uniref:NHLP bacteriocin export ABC transporter permease/ATPase subunit n=1 Tax=Anaerotignum sp. TaxID=2039241 RepID=UPI002714F8E8|nr:NHLP bacteriocin export ABC transporter permease/ATPase subunit [Anaerotignum sp.]